MRKIKIIGLKKVEILIIDGTNCEGIKICIPSSSSFSILPVREIPLIFHYSFFFRFIVRLINFNKIKDAFFFALIDYLNPKVLITHIDNSNAMSKLHKEFPNKLAISVQNSLRTGSKYPEAFVYPAPVSVFYGYGDYLNSIFIRNNIYNLEYVSAGSLTYDLYKKTDYGSIENKYDFCFISSFVDVNTPQMNILMDSNTRILESLVKICKEFGFSLSIAMRYEISSEHYIDELNFINKIDTHGIAEIIPNNLSIHLGYQTAEKSNILVTTHSTLGVEFFGAGKKVLFGASADNFALAHNWDSYGNFNKLPSMNLLDYLTVESILPKLNFLISIGSDEYIKKTKNARQHYMNYTNAKTASELIKDRISKFLLNQ